jgi:hypothetical protein
VLPECFKSSDPDIRIQEEMTAVSLRKLIAIEVKAGLDFSKETPKNSASGAGMG